MSTDPLTESSPPRYLRTAREGLLRQKVQDARERLAACTLCPRQCRVNRLQQELGVCKTGASARVSSHGPHFGEEAPLSGTHGSGTIFFTHCSLLCLFCQNYDISHRGLGREVSPEHLAEMMLSLQEAGCHNINFVTPTHVVAQILEALQIAVGGGLRVPLVYNCGGYETVETLKLLEGVFDIYMPDFKFWNEDLSQAACRAKNYPQIARDALIEMHRQVGDLVTDENGLAVRGLLIRHLVLPQGQADTRQIARFIAHHISRNSYVNIMAQYYPRGRASELPGLSARLSTGEYTRAVQEAVDEGITRLDDRVVARRR